ncbi:MAG: acetyl-CoA carboxylase carboxyltransferase subunit beta [Hungatella sp.]|nr:acetyl-CoA carboxylase carboxyltransferase subunit beta [Hungatella sp.]
MLKDMFKKTYTLIDTKYKSQGKEPNIPEGLWKKCRKCGQPVYRDDVIDNYYTCPKCKAYFRVHAYRRVEITADEGSFEEWNKEMEFHNPLDFPGYEEKVKAAREKTRLNEAIVTGRCRIQGMEAALGVCDARFLMSSMGHVVGEKITSMVERATKERLPVIIFACSGGARMQEGCVSLMQMAKTSGALKRHHEAGLLFVSVLTDPTTGGVTASFAMLGDMILAEPGALIGFAGPRVIQQTIGQKLPEGFQRAEFLMEHGFVDRIVARKDMKETLGQILKFHKKGRPYGESPEEHVDNASDHSSECGKPADRSADPSANAGTDAKDRPVQNSAAAAGISGKTAWDHVLLSRRSDRPVAGDYIEAIFDDFMELHGDRYFGDDGAIIGGIAMFHGMPVTVIGQQKGKTTKDNISRNFGMPSPEGYRKALRLMKQAEVFGRPVICFVDTPGAFCGIEAEERGQGEAIARNLFELSDLKVPMLSVVIGEGGSGGALAMAVANEVWMLENAIYSVLSPEGFASILWKDSKRADEAAGVMKITAGDLMKLGIIDQVIPEKEPVCSRNLEEMASDLDKRIEQFLEKYGKMTDQELREHRYKRFRRI